ncbi:MAG: hypothetical protein WC054_13185 [Candidatus Nanopelagicales bacterium]
MALAKYNGAHPKIRAALLASAIGQPCHFCGKPMLPGQRLDLDHTVDGSAYRGMAHMTCNRRDGGKRGRAAQLRSQRAAHADPGPSRTW